MDKPLEELTEQELLEWLDAFDKKCQAEDERYKKERKAEKERYEKERLEWKKINQELKEALRDLERSVKINYKPNKDVWGNDVLAN